MQRRVLSERRRFNVLAAGRRWSKSTTAQLLLIEAQADYFAAEADYHAALADDPFVD